MSWIYGHHRSRNGETAIVNMSLGLLRSNAMNQAVQELNDAGLLVVVSINEHAERHPLFFLLTTSIHSPHAFHADYLIMLMMLHRLRLVMVMGMVRL
jgi:hypothetical protein